MMLNTKYSMLVLFYFLIAITIFFYPYLYVTRSAISNIIQYQNIDTRQTIFVITSWTPHIFFSTEEMVNGSHFFKNCPRSNCVLNFNRSLVHQSKLVLFEWIALWRGKTEIPRREKDQLWAFLTLESPATDSATRGMDRYSRYNKIFNLTITYRTDSTIYMPYSRVNIRKRDVPKDFTPVTVIAKNKTKTAAWFISGSIDLSRRWKTVTDLINHGVSVDIIGENNKHKCPKTEEQKCIKMLETDYKFYLAFENSICKDYITEKLFKVLPIHVVPVVLGGGNYRSILPKEAYIDATDFKSTKDLAEYLISLDKDDEKYLKYLSWRCKYDMQIYDGIQAAFCNICQKINEDTLRPDLRTTADIKNWWFTSKCLDKTDSFNRDVIDKYYNYTVL